MRPGEKDKVLLPEPVDGERYEFGEPWQLAFARAVVVPIKSYMAIAVIITGAGRAFSKFGMELISITLLNVVRFIYYLLKKRERKTNRFVIM